MALKNWTDWQPVERTVLIVLFAPDGQLLLIRKKRGLGVGKITPPGGRIEPNESEEDAARRELKEETGVVAPALHRRARLCFQFVNGYSMETLVFVGFQPPCEVTPCDEADPFWLPWAHLPWNQVWADDILWLPAVQKGLFVQGWFVFKEDLMMESRVNFSPL